jgi:hypothetical protein
MQRWHNRTWRPAEESECLPLSPGRGLRVAFLRMRELWHYSVDPIRLESPNTHSKDVALLVAADI